VGTESLQRRAPNVTHDKGGHMYIGLGTLVVVLVIVMIISFIRRA
jgi:hypothetical protein